MNIFIIKTARSLLRERLPLLTSILGLCGGFLCLTYSSLNIIHNIKIDRFNEKFDRIYRVLYKQNTDIKGSSPFIIKSLLQNIPEIEKSARFIKSDVQIKKDNQLFLENNLKYVDKEIFSIYTFPIIYGNKANFLNEPNSVVLSEILSTKYFGDNNPIGEELTIRLNNKEFILRIDGVVKDISDQSSFTANMFVNFDVYEKRFNNASFKSSYVDLGFTTVLTTKPNVDERSFNEKFTNYFKEYFKNDSSIEYLVQPLRSIYFHSGYLGNNKFLEGNLNLLILLGSVSFIVFIIALINYSLLSISVKLSNLKEIGLMKVFGANRWDYLKVQMIESFCLSLVTVILTIFLLFIFISKFNQLLNIDFNFSRNDIFPFAIICITIVFLTSLLSGLYISTVLFRYNPTIIFKQDSKHNLSKNPYLKSLLVLQLAAICILLGTTFSLNSNLSGVFNYNVGYDNSNLMIVDLDLKEKGFSCERLLEIIKQNPIVENASAADLSIHELGRQTTSINLNSDIDLTEVDYLNVDPSYPTTLKLSLLSGRLFYANDSNSIIINEKLAKLFNSNPVGKIINGKVVIGVVKDFNFRSVYEPITPLFIELSPRQKFQLLLKTYSSINSSSINIIRDIILENAPDLSFHIYDYQTKLKMTYMKEYNLRSLLTLFIFLSFILTFTGLFSFSFYLSQSKLKEMCIRRVHGADHISIIGFISKDFLSIIVISNIFALPLPYYISNKIFNQFIIQTQLNLADYILTFICTAAFVVGILIIRTNLIIRQDIIQHLKYE